MIHFTKFNKNFLLIFFLFLLLIFMGHVISSKLTFLMNTNFRLFQNKKLLSKLVSMDQLKNNS